MGDGEMGEMVRNGEQAPITVQRMRRTRAYPSRGLPAGAYATTIEPWADKTQKELAELFYFSPTRQSAVDLSWYVILCNDVPTYFVPIDSVQWVKEDGYRYTRVRAIGE